MLAAEPYRCAELTVETLLQATQQLTARQPAVPRHQSCIPSRAACLHFQVDVALRKHQIISDSFCIHLPLILSTVSRASQQGCCVLQQLFPHLVAPHTVTGPRIARVQAYTAAHPRVNFDADHPSTCRPQAAFQAADSVSARNIAWRRIQAIAMLPRSPTGKLFNKHAPRPSWDFKLCWLLSASNLGISAIGGFGGWCTAHSAISVPHKGVPNCHKGYSLCVTGEGLSHSPYVMGHISTRKPSEKAGSQISGCV